MRYLLPLLFAFCLFSCNEPTPVSADEPRDPLIDSAEKYNQLFHQEKKTNLAFASVYAELGLAYSQKADYDRGIAEGNANMGHVHFVRQEFELALATLDSAIKQYTVFNDSAGIANCSYTIGNVNLMQQDYESAMIFQTRALELHRAINMHDQVSSDMKSISMIYTETGKFDSAIAVCKRRVLFEEQTGDSLSVASALSDLAGVYIASGDAESGLNFRVAALTKLKSGGIDSSSHEVQLFNIQLLNNLAADYFLQNDQGKAIRTGQEALALAKQIGARNEKRSALKTLAELYGLSGREDVQLQLLEQYVLLNDSVLNEEMQSRVAATDMKCTLVEQQLHAAELAAQASADQLVAQEEDADKRTMLMWILISTLLIVTLGAIIYAKKLTRQ